MKEIKCPYCHSKDERKNGRYKDGVQRYMCNECGTQFRGKDRENIENFLQRKKTGKDFDKSVFWKEDE